jgi:nucleoside phosphorylase
MNAFSSEQLKPTIGLITALPKEYNAVKAVLDIPRPFTVPGRGAGRRYTLGQVPTSNGGSHYVVLALAAKGNNIAATRATRLLSHFPNVDSIIMVGIAGGIPYPSKPDEHVRLGDIVISDYRGVVKYDFDKETVTESIPRHPPRPPSASLLEAVELLQAEEDAGSYPWRKYLDAAIRKRQVSRPLAKSDILIDTLDPSIVITHPKDPNRRKGQPRVFLGPIASADKLLKNPIKRDRLRDTFGVKAVEMEGSGIADATWFHEVGYLVIRGICDYCDSNKGDVWQRYAAFVAAAYTRALVESIPSQSHSLPDPTELSKLYPAASPPPSRVDQRATNLPIQFDADILTAFRQAVRRDVCDRLEIFQSPREFPEIGAALNTHYFAFLIGEPWVGKTFTALRVLYEYFAQGYNFLWIPYGREVPQELTDQPERFLNTYGRTAIYLEDPFGRETTSRSAERVANSLHYLLRALQRHNGDVILIATSWTYTFQNALVTKPVFEEMTSKKVIVTLGEQSYTPKQLNQIVLGHLAQNNSQLSPEEQRNISNSILAKLRRPGQIEDAIGQWDTSMQLVGLQQIIETVANIDESLPAELGNARPEVLAVLVASYIYHGNPLNVVADFSSLGIDALKRTGESITASSALLFEEILPHLLDRDWVRVDSFSNDVFLQLGHTTRTFAFRNTLKQNFIVRANTSAIVDELLNQNQPSALIDLTDFLVSNIDVMYPSGSNIKQIDLRRLERRLKTLLEKGSAVKGELAYAVTGHLKRYEVWHQVRQLLSEILDELASDTDPLVRLIIAGAIAENFEALPQYAKGIFELLATDKSPIVKHGVAEAYVWRTPNLPTHYRALFQRLLLDPDPEVRGMIADLLCFIYDIEEIAERVEAKQHLPAFFDDPDDIVLGWLIFASIFHRDAVPGELAEKALDRALQYGISSLAENAFVSAVLYHLRYLEIHSILKSRQDMLRKFLAGTTNAEQSKYRGSTELLREASPFSKKALLVLDRLSESRNADVRSGVLFITVAHGPTGTVGVQEKVEQLLRDEELKNNTLAQAIARFFQLN